MTILSCEVMSEFIKRHNYIKELYLSWNQINVEGG
jgi:hypothetical protein